MTTLWVWLGLRTKTTLSIATYIIEKTSSLNISSFVDRKYSWIKSKYNDKDTVLSVGTKSKHIPNNVLLLATITPSSSLPSPDEKVS